MFKWIIGGIFLLACVYVGYGIDRYYAQRLKILTAFEGFLRYVKREIDFLKTDLPALIEGYSTESPEFAEVMNSASQALKNNEKPVFESKYLEQSASRELSAILNAIAELNYDGRAAYFSHALETGATLVAEAKREKTQKGELSRKLLILLGVGLVIMLI